MEEQICVRYTTTMEDVLAFHDFHYAHSPSQRRLLGTLRWLGALAIFCMTVTTTVAIPSIVLGLIMATLFVAIYPWMTRKIIRGQARMMYSEGRNKGVLGEHELQVCEDGIVERSPYTERKTAWGAVERIQSTPNHTFIYVGSMLAHVVPHRDIAEGEYKAFLAQLGRQFQPDRRLEKPGIPGS